MSFASSKAVNSIGSVGLQIASAVFAPVATPTTVATVISNAVILDQGGWILKVSASIVPAGDNTTELGRTVLRIIDGANATVEEYLINFANTGALLSANGPLRYSVCLPVSVQTSVSSAYRVSLLPVITAGTDPTATATITATKLV